MLNHLLSGILSSVLVGLALSRPAVAVAAETEAGPTRVAIVFFSQSGNTRQMAEMIRAQTGGEWIELVPQDAYSQNYREVVARGKRELDGKIKPVLKDGKVPSIEKYDIVFIGSPNWFNTYATPLATFLAGNAFKGKVVIPFCTYGSKAGNTMADIVQACPGAVAKDGLGLRGKDVKENAAKVTQWLDGLGLKK